MKFPKQLPYTKRLLKFRYGLSTWTEQTRSHASVEVILYATSDTK